MASPSPIFSIPRIFIKSRYWVILLMEYDLSLPVIVENYFTHRWLSFVLNVFYIALKKSFFKALLQAVFWRSNLRLSGQNQTVGDCFSGKKHRFATTSLNRHGKNFSRQLYFHFQPANKTFELAFYKTKEIEIYEYIKYLNH